jgi:hypothetical protein
LAVFGAIGDVLSQPRVLAKADSCPKRFCSVACRSQLLEDQGSSVLSSLVSDEEFLRPSDAVVHLISASQGFSYLLQQFSEDSWDVAAGLTVITSADIREGALLDLTACDAGNSRKWGERATCTSQRYVVEMVDDGDSGSPAAAVGGWLERQVSSRGRARASLVAKRLILAPEHGRAPFTVSGMAASISRQLRENWR